MIFKGRIPFVYGGQPPRPRDLTLYEQKHDKNKGSEKNTAPCLCYQFWRSGCFPAEPYPPNWWTKNSMKFINYKTERIIKK